MNKTEQGSRAEKIALSYLEQAGLVLVCRNYKTPGRGGGEVDLIMQEPSSKGSTLVFVEVRLRANHLHGGAGASVGGVKQRRLIFAARHYLLKLRHTPPCRFDVVTLDGDLHHQPRLEWLQGAFDAPSY
jgi:putative endonuclease